jgi:hypothetical protein
LSPLGRWLRTLRHATPAQLGARALHEARLRAYPVAGPLLERLYAKDPAARLAIAAVPALQQGPTELPAVQPEPLTRLQRYERQYQSELIGLSRLGQVDEARDHVERWAAANPIGVGEAWEPYPVARRVLSWSVALAVAPGLAEPMAPLLAPQVRFVAHHLEWHLLGNHLLCDAAALTAGAAVLDFEGSAELFARGAALLQQELRKQVLPDGGYAERTAQYHALVLRDALWALSLARARGRALPIEPELQRLAHWLVQVRRGRELPCLNDSTPAAAALCDEALALCAALGVPAGARAEGDLELPDTGWSFVREGDHELLFDHGPLGPDEQPGHGHSDALAYELVWAGVPVVTDTGVSSYEPSATRDFERSAKAHATVTVDGQGPDELWAAFRAGARGVVSAEPRWERSGARVLRGRVDAPAGWDHQRTLVFWPGRALVVIDRVDGEPDGAQVISRVPFDPAWAVGPASATHQGGLTLYLDVLRGEALDAARDGWVCHGFGARTPRAVWTVRAELDGVAAYSIAAAGVQVELGEERLVLRAHDGERTIELAES